MIRNVQYLPWCVNYKTWALIQAVPTNLIKPLFEALEAAYAKGQERDLKAYNAEIQAARKARGEAAKVCDSYSDTCREMAAWAKNDSERASSYSLQALAAQSCAESIRALKDKPSPASGEQINAVPDDPVAVHWKHARTADGYPRELNQDALRALAAHYAKVPEGYALVPLEPTEAALWKVMIAGEMDTTSPKRSGLARAKAAYNAALAAAKQEADR